MAVKWIIRHKNKVGSHLSRRSVILIWAILLTLFFAMFLLGFSFQFTNNETLSQPFQESVEPYYSSMMMNYSGPNYFFPHANLAYSIANRYSDEINGFHFFISFDNSTWVEIPLTKPLQVVDKFTDPRYSLTNVGRIPLSGFSNMLYMKCFFPPQGLNESDNERVANSFEAYLQVEPIWTPQSWATLALVTLAVLSFFIQILDFWFKARS